MDGKLCCYNAAMRPDLTVRQVLEQASALLGQGFRKWRQATAGADHLVIFATMETGEKVVLKAGLEAHVDAYALQWLRDTGVAIPRLLAHGRINAEKELYSLAVMTFVDGVLLANVSDEPHRYLAPLFAELRKVHAVTTTKGAGEVACSAATSWKDYLLGILNGEHPEFRWTEIAQHPWVDAAVLIRALSLAIRQVESLPDLPRLSLLHGDLNPYNIIVDEDRIAGIIDWSYVRFGDPLFDLARLRMNPFVRSHPEATATYFALAKFRPAAQERERTYYLVHLIEYVNWYVLDNNPSGVRDHIGLLAQLCSCQ